MGASIGHRVIAAGTSVVSCRVRGGFAARTLGDAKRAVRETVWHTGGVTLPIVAGEHHAEGEVIIVVGGTLKRGNEEGIRRW